MPKSQPNEIASEAQPDAVTLSVTHWTDLGPGPLTIITEDKSGALIATSTGAAAPPRIANDGSMLAEIVIDTREHVFAMALRAPVAIAVSPAKELLSAL